MVLTMTSVLRQQIEQLDPRRYARAAKRAAILARELADRAGTEVSESIRHLIDTPEDQIAAERERQVAARDQIAKRSDERGGANNPPSAGSITLAAAGPTAATAQANLPTMWEKNLEGLARTTQVEFGKGSFDDLIHGESRFPYLPITGGLMPPAANLDLEPLIASADESAKTIASLFSSHSEGYQQLSAQAEEFRSEFANALNMGADAWRKSLFGATESLAAIGRPLLVAHDSRKDWSKAVALLNTWNSSVPSDFFAHAQTLERGDRLTSHDHDWRAGRLIDNDNLVVSIRGRPPWMAPLEFDDVVRVDPEGGFMLIESQHRRPRWLGKILSQTFEVKSFRNGLAVLLQVSSTSDVADFRPISGRATGNTFGIDLVCVFDRGAENSDWLSQSAPSYAVSQDALERPHK